MNTSNGLSKFLFLTALSCQLAFASSDLEFRDEEGNVLDNVVAAPAGMRFTPNQIEVQGEIFSYDRCIRYNLSAEDGRRLFILDGASVYRTLAEGFEFVIGSVPRIGLEAMPGDESPIEQLVLNRRITDVRNVILEYLANLHSVQN